MSEEKYTYTTRGSVCGSCDHKHRTPETAEKCQARHYEGCVKQGGYSDRVIIRSDGEQMVPAFYEGPLVPVSYLEDADGYNRYYDDDDYHDDDYFGYYDPEEYF